MANRIIVLGNEKGGTGKSTLTMHLAIYLIHQGKRVGVMDLDAHQGTLSRYCENRAQHQSDLIQPRCIKIHKSKDASYELCAANELREFNAALESLSDCDHILVDTPGHDTHLAHIPLAMADILLTPINDSLVDLDLIARNTNGIFKPSIYAETVWKQRMERAAKGFQPTQWFLVRNRISALRSNNREEMSKTIDELAKRMSFKVCSGFYERVIFRELFNSGLTILDFEKQPKSLSHIAARSEIRRLATELGLHM